MGLEGQDFYNNKLFYGVNGAASRKHFDGEVLRYYVYFLIDQSISSPSIPCPPATPMLMVLRSLNCGTLENAGIFLPICVHGVGSACLGLKSATYIPLLRIVDVLLVLNIVAVVS